MSENNATRTLRTHLQAYGCHCQRFEDKLSPGIPDTGVGALGVYAFLEGKFIKQLPTRETTLVRFGSKDEPRLAHQFNWLTAHDKAGGLAMWWIRVRDVGWYLFDDRYVWLKTGVPKDILLQERNLGSGKAMADEITKRMALHASRLAQ